MTVLCHFGIRCTWCISIICKHLCINWHVHSIISGIIRNTRLNICFVSRERGLHPICRPRRRRLACAADQHLRCPLIMRIILTVECIYERLCHLPDCIDLQFSLHLHQVNDFIISEPRNFTLFTIIKRWNGGLFQYQINEAFLFKCSVIFLLTVPRQCFSCGLLFMSLYAFACMSWWFFFFFFFFFWISVWPIFWERNCPFGFALVVFWSWCRCFKCILLSLWYLGWKVLGNCIDSWSLPFFLFKISPKPLKTF